MGHGIHPSAVRLLLAYSALHIASGFIVPGHHCSFSTRSTTIQQRTHNTNNYDTNNHGLPTIHDINKHHVRLPAKNGDGLDFLFDEDFENNDDEGSAENSEADGASSSRTDKLRRIRNFLRSTGGLSSKSDNMVRPIALDGTSLDPVLNDSRDVVRPKFDSLFQGVPGIGEILGSSSSSPTSGNDGNSRNDKEIDEDDAWKQSLQRQKQQRGGEKPTARDFDTTGLTPEDVEAIDQNFETFQMEMREKLSNLRKKDPESVPDNAEFILDQVVEEQRAYDLKEMKESRSVQSYEEYASMRRKQMEDALKSRSEMGINNSDDDTVAKDILDEYESINKGRETDERNMQEFLEYERESKKLRETLVKQNNELNKSAVWDEDSDVMQLRLMEELLEIRQNSVAAAGFEDEDIYTTDNLEDGIDEIRAKIEAKKARELETFTTPETLKEWQIYRAIATQMTNNDNDDGSSVEIDNETIGKQLQAWKDFQQKEEEMRQKAGLTIKTRMPFPWHGKDVESGQRKLKSSIPFDAAKSAEARSELDDKAMEIMQSLIERTTDTTRRLKLEQELANLKRDISQQKQIRENNVGQMNTASSNQVKEVDISGVFGKKESIADKPIESTTTLNASPPRYNLKERTDDSIPTSSVLTSESDQQRFESEGNYDVRSESSHPTPNTPFFTSSTSDDGYDHEEPNTINNEFDSEDVESLGSFQEQKFRSLVARSGVRTVEEEEELRKKWEAFQEAENQMRSRTGLSEVSDFTSMDQSSASKVKYDMSRVVKDGDIDADAILATIGKRPSRKKSISKENTFGLRTTEGENTKVNINADESISSSSIDNIMSESLDKNNIENDGDSDTYYKNETDKWAGQTFADQLYRNVAATGGGIARDSANSKAKDKAQFEEYLKKEEEMRQRIQNLSSDELGSSLDENSDSFDADSYAQNALLSIGTRPQVKKQTNIIYDNMLEKNTGKDEDTSNFSVEDELAEPNMRKQVSRYLPSTVSEKMPDWLRREQEERGGAEEWNIKDTYNYPDEEYFEDEERFEENLRQAEEFERKHSKTPKQINIGEVFGREYFGPDDYGDYYSGGKGIDDSFSSFELRKQNLLEYTELSVAELNSLIDYKTSSLETGISPYLRTVNKPFSAFGVIFRVEGVLIDFTGLQAKAWIETAKEYNFRIPSIEDIKFSAVHKPDFVVQRIFYWTSDLIECKNIVKTHEEKFSAAFSEWIENVKNMTPDKDSETLSSEIDDSEETRKNQKETNPLSSLSDEDVLNIQFEAWKKTSEQLKMPTPSLEMIHLAKSFSPDQTIRSIFNWTKSPSESANMTATFKFFFKERTKHWMQINNVNLPLETESFKRRRESETVLSKSSGNLSKNEITDIRLQAWKATAESFNYEVPTSDEIETASFIGLENAVTKLFKWTDDQAVIDEVISSYRGKMKELSNQFINKAEVVKKTNSVQDSLTDELFDTLEPVVLQDNVHEWINSLQLLSVPCAIISFLNETQLEAVLEYTGLSELFPNEMRVSTNNDYRVENQQMLGAALRIERRPDHCVVFDTTPQATVAAHDVEMKSISIVDPYPYYDLTACDLSGRDINALGISKIRNVFNEAQNQEPMQELQYEEPMISRRPKLKTRFWEEGDRW